MQTDSGWVSTTLPAPVGALKPSGRTSPDWTTSLTAQTTQKAASLSQQASPQREKQDEKLPRPLSSEVCVYVVEGGGGGSSVQETGPATA